MLYRGWARWKRDRLVLELVAAEHFEVVQPCILSVSLIMVIATRGHVHIPLGITLTWDDMIVDCIYTRDE
jgi:hypothetical protein